MSEFDALRQLMGQLAGDPPPPLDRQEAVMSRISRRLQRQAALRGVAAVAVLAVIGVGAVKTTLHLNPTGSESGTVTEPRHSPSPSPRPSQEPSHSAAPSHEASVPASTAASAPSAAATGTPAPAPSTAAGEPSRPPTAPPAAGAPSPENTAASGPLTVDLSMSPSTVDTSQEARALVTARDGSGRLLAVDIAWGDGKTLHFSPGAVPCPRTTHFDGSFGHRYGSPGTYTVHVTVTTGDCAPEEKVSRDAQVTVTAAASNPPASSPASPSTAPTTYSNGPAQPVAGATKQTGSDPATAYLNVSAGDQDGFVRRASVDWGDGTAPTAAEWSLSSCTNAAGTDHPGPTHHDANVSHHYTSAGPHTVTVTVSSVACDDSHTQTGSTSLSVSQ